MFLPFKPKNRLAIYFFAALSILLFSCQKEVSLESAALPGGGSGGSSTYDLSTKINSSVSGFVTNENNDPVKDAVISFGAFSTTTDKYGYFEAKNISVIKNAAFVKVAKQGYFNAIKTYIAETGRSAFFRIKLIPKTNAGIIDAAAGGSVVLPNGLKIVLPAASVVNSSTNATYTGPVHVAAHWIDPVSAELNQVMPGDLRGINTAGAMRLLATYGMAAVELTGAGGVLLQVAPGKKATLSFPIPASLAASAPSAIPLWYFNENNGLWKEEGSASRSGNVYTGDVGHFSYWNCDVPIPDAVQFNCTIVDASGNPVPNAEVGIYYSNGLFTGCKGVTGTDGYTGGIIPGNAQLILKVFDPICPLQLLTTQAISTGTGNISLGNIAVAINNIATITGSIKNCTNQAVTNGYVMLRKGTNFMKYPVNNTGNFSISTTYCGSTTVTLIGGDNTTGQEGLSGPFVLNSGSNNVGNIVACASSNQEYVNYTTDGTAYSIIPGVPSWGVTVVHATDVMYPNSFYIEANGPITTLYFRFNDQNISAGSSQELYHFWEGIIGMPQMPATPVSVHITEYGSVGQFISGNFSGTIYDFNPPHAPHAITCSFRVRRQF